MKSIFLCAVVICALAIAGIGGTFATWSDSETSEGNTIVTGSLDLKVNGADDLPYGTGVPAKVKVECMIPCKWYGPYEVELWNAGQCEFPSHAYIHVKKLECSNVPPKEVGGVSTGYLAPDGSGLKPEPELVAEYGGKVNCITVTGIGPEGDDCSMTSHVMMNVTTGDTGPEDGLLFGDQMGKYECKELYLFDLMPCQPKTIYLWFHLAQDTEEYWGKDYIPDPGDVGYDELYWKKFNDWPSWALMKDKLTFNLEFDLWLEDP